MSEADRLASGDGLGAPRWSRLRWEVAAVARRIGWPGWVAAALLLACLILFEAELRPARDDAARLDADSAALRKRLAQAPRTAAATEVAPEQQIAEFQRRFGDDRGIAVALARLQAIATRQGVRLDRAEFKFVSEPNEPLARYTMILPVKADYRALRRLSRDALRELPGLSMEEINLRRSDTKSPVLEAQLRFVLFLTKPSAAENPAAVTP